MALTRWKSRILSDGREPFGLHTMRWRCGWPSKSWQVNGSFSLFLSLSLSLFGPEAFVALTYIALFSLSLSLSEDGFGWSEGGACQREAGGRNEGRACEHTWGTMPAGNRTSVTTKILIITILVVLFTDLTQIYSMSLIFK